MKEKWCELCAAKGLKKKLRCCRVNFEEAIILCENTMCIYPFGSTDVDSLLVKRTCHKADEQNRKGSRCTDVRKVEKKECFPPSCLASLFHWSNTDSLCWLDSVLTVLVHNRCFQLCLEKVKEESILKELCYKFIRAQNIGPVQKGRSLLDEARTAVFQFLKSKMQCVLGVDDSPVMALSLLLKENSYISEKFLQEYVWRFACTMCGYVQVNRFKKLIVTFPNTTEDFCMPSGYFLRPCYKCKSPGQRSTLEFQQMPPCVVAHFVEGVSNGDFLKSQFSCHGKEYKLCQIIQYKKNPDHFVSWVRNSNGTHWAEVDDMKDAVCKWQIGAPTVLAKQIHLAVWERTSLYQKNLPSTEGIEKPGTVQRERNLSSQILHDSNKQSLSVSTTGFLKEPPLLRINSPALDVKSEPKVSSVNRTSTSTVKISSEKNTISVVCENSDANKKPLGSSHENKRKDAMNFEPYIPKKKRSVSLEAAVAIKNMSESLVPESFSSETNCEGLSSFVESGTKSEAFLPWLDAVSASVGEKLKQCVGDNQSDSGYSSPGSNSSCLSLPVTSAKEGSSLDDFLESLDSLDLPDVVKTSKCGLDSVKVDCETSENIISTLDDILPADLLFEPCDTDEMQWLDSAMNFEDLNI